MVEMYDPIGVGVPKAIVDYKRWEILDRSFFESRILLLAWKK